ncbi:hypothetical protein BGZ76_005805, partial [Entomortierella beljakovae]
MTSDQHFQGQSQRFRVIYKSEHSAPPNTNSEITDIAIHHDVVTEMDVVLWEDILFVFKDTLSVRNGSLVIPFLKGRDLRNLDPLRIPAKKEVIYDVILETPVQSAFSQSNNAANVPETSSPSPILSAPKGGENTVTSKEDDSVAEQHQAEHTKGSVGMKTSYQDFLDFINTKLQSGTKISQEDLEPYLKAALEGSSEYQFQIGDMFYSEEVVEQDYANAMCWFHKAAEQGHAIAQYNIGDMHGQGLGVPQDHAKAMEWFLKAAEQGHASAQYNIG